MKKLIFHSLLLSLTLTSCSLFGISNLENPNYEVALRDNNIEIRSYNATKLVSTHNQGEFTESSNNNFRKLFKYISGNNKSEEKISMTSPVFMNLSDLESNSRQMSFVVPSINLENTPEPSSSEVTITSFPQREVAVISFSGRWEEQSFRDKERALRNWINEKGYIAKSEAYAAAYNPPWAIPFLRRNEVHIAIRISDK